MKINPNIIVKSLAIVLFFSISAQSQTLLEEDFDALTDILKPAVSEPIPSSILGWTHTPPEGWTIDNSKMGSTTGMPEWQGWSFATLTFWTSADTQNRGNFSLSKGVLAIADPDEWDDLNTPSASGFFNSTLSSPPIRVAAGQQLYLYFDSHYRQENEQQAQVSVSFNGEPSSVLLTYNEKSSSDNHGGDKENEHVVLAIPAPETDNDMLLSWELSKAKNNWYWAIDNISVSMEAPPTPTPAPIPTPTPKPIVSNGPFVKLLDETSAQVMWETAEAGTSIIDYDNANGNNRIEDPAPKTKHQLVMMDLEQGAECDYSIKSTIRGSELYGGTFSFDTTFEGTPRELSQASSPFPEDDLTLLFESAAETIVQQSKVDKGYCFVLGFGEGRLAYEIARRTNLKIIGIEEDADKVAAARKCLRSAGVYGNRISVSQGSLSNLPFSNYFANLIVSEQFLMTGEPVGSASEMFRVLRPCGGVIVLGQPKNAPNLINRENMETWLTSGGIKENVVTEDSSGLWIKNERPPLANSGEWTHHYANPSNTACSQDQQVQAPMHALWYGRPGPRLIINRHSRPMSPLYKNGRVFIPADDRIIAIDAYNGTRQWDLSVPGSRRMGAFKGSAQMVVTDEYVYIAQNNQCQAVDVVSGMPAFSLHVPQHVEEEKLDWGYLACVDDRIVGTGHKMGTPFYDYTYNGNCNELEGDNRACMISDFIFSQNRRTGETLWTYRNGSILESAIAIGGDRVYFAENRNLPNPQGQWEGPGRRWVGNFTRGNETYIVALNLQTGDKVWEQRVDLPFTEMMYLSYADGVIITTGTYNQNADCHYALFAFDSNNGQPKWNDDYDSGENPGGSHGEQWQHPVIMNGTIFSRPYYFDLQTGERESFTLGKGGRCGTYSASSGFLFARESNPSYYQYGSSRVVTRPLTKVTRPGCFINIIPVGGLVLLPESSSGCTCEYSLQTSMAFIPE